MSLTSEPEMENLLHQLIPNLDEQLVEATAEEIKIIENIAGPLFRVFITGSYKTQLESFIIYFLML